MLFSTEGTAQLKIKDGGKIGIETNVVSWNKLHINSNTIWFNGTESC